MPKKTKNSKLGKPSACVFCKSSEDDELQFGKFFHSGELSVHNFCLLFSSGLSQNGKNDDDGFAGFLAKDIRKEVDRGKRLKCSYCKGNGATIGCCKPVCKRVFHLNCGLKHKSLHLFFGSFPSYCYAHKPKPIYPNDELPTKELFCSICYNVVNLKDYDTTVWTSCCKNGWFHKTCIQRQASSAGYFFRCPLCNNSEQFQKQMLDHGIYIPQQDAAWELEENAFQELLIRHGQCDATRCLCPKGRKHNTKKTSQWHLVLCEDCGSQGRHVGCDSSISSKHFWKCEACTEITQKLKSKKKKNVCLDKKVEKGQIADESEPHEEARGTRVFRRATVKVEPIIVPTSSILGEKQVSDKTCVALHSSQPSPKNTSPYKIIRITKSEPITQTESSSACQENEICEVSEIALLPYNQETSCTNGGQTFIEQNSPKKTGNSSLDNMQCETSMSIDDDVQAVEKSSLKESNANDIFSDFPKVIAGVPGKSLNFSQEKSEHFLDGDDVKELELPSNSWGNNMLDDCKEMPSLSISDNSSHFLHGGKSLTDLPSDVCDIMFDKNEIHNRNHKREGLNDINFTEAENCERNKSTAANSVITHCVDYKTPVPTKNDGKSSLAEEEALQYPHAPRNTLKISSKSHARHPKRIYSDMEERFRKKHKGNGTVIIVSIKQGTEEITTHEIKEKHHKAHKNTVNLESKTINEISLPASSSRVMPHDGHRIEEKLSKEALNVGKQKKTPIIMNVHRSSEFSRERDHREPLMKLGSSNGLVQNVLKSECSDSNYESYNSSGQRDKDDIESENRAIEKQKLSAVMSKRHFTSHSKYKDNYLCVKALLGKSCSCCVERSRHSKQSSGKGKFHRKHGLEGCKSKYVIDCYKSGSLCNKLGEKSLVGKHSTDCHSKFVVDHIRSGPSLPEMVNENKEKGSVKLSVKPQVIHLKNAYH